MILYINISKIKNIKIPPTYVFFSYDILHINTTDQTMPAYKKRTENEKSSLYIYRLYTRFKQLNVHNVYYLLFYILCNYHVINKKSRDQRLVSP